MKYKGVFLFFIFLYLIGINSFSESRLLSERDGNDWIGANEWFKLGLISGMIMGVSLSTNYKPKINIFDSFSKLKDKESIFLELLDLRTFFKHLDRIPLYNITIGQIKDGLDEFYKDFSTRRIRIIDAIYVVKMQIEGKSPELIEAQILYLKRQPISEEKILKAWGKYFDFEKVHSREPEYKDIMKGEFSREDLLTIGKFIDSKNEEHNLFCYGKYK